MRKGRGASIREQLGWIFASHAERRLYFCRECRVRRDPESEACSNCGARVSQEATPSA